jgi:hypothetical protein
MTDLFGNQVGEKSKEIDMFNHPTFGKLPVTELITKVGVRKKIEYYETISAGWLDTRTEKFRDKIIHALILNDGTEIYKVNRGIFKDVHLPKERIKRKIW